MARREPTRCVLPVRISVTTASRAPAQTVDITCEGARIGGLRQQLRPGIVIDLRRQMKTAKFRVVWVLQLGPNEIQAVSKP